MSKQCIGWIVSGMLWSADICSSTMRTIWTHLPSLVAGGEDVGVVSGVSEEQCKLLCCQRHCDAVNYHTNIGLCEMREFSKGVQISEAADVDNNVSVSVTQGFQCRLITHILSEFTLWMHWLQIWKWCREDSWFYEYQFSCEMDTRYVLMELCVLPKCSSISGLTRLAPFRSARHD